jgi:hypothetical protein
MQCFNAVIRAAWTERGGGRGSSVAARAAGGRVSLPLAVLRLARRQVDRSVRPYSLSRGGHWRIISANLGSAVGALDVRAIRVN